VNVSVFVYSERQDELVGTDGVDSFSKIFAEESRVVVVLYREGWGQTKWTRVEENAIRSRGFNEGHEFVLLVKLNTANPPIWLPPTRIYLGFERYGIDGVASAIETRVQATGGEIKSESVADYAARISRDLDFETQRRYFLNSHEGAESAKQQVEILFGQLKHLAEQVTLSSNIELGYERPSADFCRLFTRRVRFGVTWHLLWGNTLDDAGLTFIMTEGGSFFGPYTMKEPDRKVQLAYSVDLDRSGAIGWRESQGDKRFLTSNQVAEVWIKLLLESEHGRATCYV
jgi:hypothetical protein